MSYDSLLTDTGTIVRRAQGAFDPVSGTYPVNDTEVYSGACRVAPFGQGQRVRVGEEAVIDQGQYVFLPLSATGVKVEDIVKVITSRDADMVNREMTVRYVAAEHSPRTEKGARWLVCEDVREGV